MPLARNSNKNQREGNTMVKEKSRDVAQVMRSPKPGEHQVGTLSCSGGSGGQ